MGFHWKDGKDQLLARSGDLPSKSVDRGVQQTRTGNPWTTFTMNLRETSILEGPLDLARFLVTSLTFMRTLKQIDMLVDDHKVLEVQKSFKERRPVTSRGLRDTSTAGMMKVTGVEATTIAMKAQVMEWLNGERIQRDCA